jgi:hypothetical protein
MKVSSPRDADDVEREAGGAPIRCTTMRCPHGAAPLPISDLPGTAGPRAEVLGQSFDNLTCVWRIILSYRPRRPGPAAGCDRSARSGCASHTAGRPMRAIRMRMLLLPTSIAALTGWAVAIATASSFARPTPFRTVRA